MTNTLFILGLILETIGFLVASVDHIPFLLRFVSPKYVEAKQATELLRDGGSLAEGQPGFEILAGITIKGLSEIKSNSPEALARIHVLSFEAAGKSGIAFGSRGVTESFPVEIKLSNGQSGEMNLVAIEKMVGELRETHLFWWGVGFFSLGIILQVVGHYFKPPASWNEL